MAAYYGDEWRDDPVDESLCGEPDCQNGVVVIGDDSLPCLECVRLGYVDRATGQVLLMEGERP